MGSVPGLAERVCVPTHTRVGQGFTRRPSTAPRAAASPRALLLLALTNETWKSWSYFLTSCRNKPFPPRTFCLIPCRLPLISFQPPQDAECWGSLGEKFSKFGVRWEPCKYVRYVHTGGGKRNILCLVFIFGFLGCSPSPS